MHNKKVNEKYGLSIEYWVKKMISIQEYYLVMSESMSILKSFVIAICVLCSVVVLSQETVKPGKNIALYVPNTKQIFDNIPFDVGETILYNATWGGIKAGTVSIQVKKRLFIGDNEVFQVVVQAKTSKFFSVFFKVDDKMESYFDCKSLYSLRFEKHLREGSYKEDQIIDYDHKRGIFEMNRERKNKKNVQEGIIPYWVNDPISCIFYLRVCELAVAKPFSITINTEGKNYNVEVNVPEKETIKTDLGKFDTFIVKPGKLAWQGRVFEKEKSTLTVWLTDDEYRLPVLLKSKVKIGSLKFEIKQWKKSGSPVDNESINEEEEEK
ncbi:MAG: hypothetical protein A2161_14920 [Candidatus Schekmanbacteria bacterium RBG_13_48_7]|uniref:DUF3108 domain-containing protein n=1 Tax=Candidatus Schekmanbacteria bacterium RBG_13_48_7 TaxID=1817878 RepID=A0A1F7RXU1_9BACT|nr:MAG: hypothetical protein A2161_14920 [Candidatus Schekmanbacteria bacterium RBG_13_48_7]